MHMDKGQGVVYICPNCAKHNTNYTRINILYLKHLFDLHENNKINLNKYSKYLKLQQITDSIKNKIDNTEKCIYKINIQDIEFKDFFVDYDFLNQLCTCDQCNE